LVISERPFNRVLDIVSGERENLKDLRPTADRRIDADVGIFGRGTDQNDAATF
jgi:hypothetical protein